jgi:hydrogenase nickel incorporation protein HypB
MCVVCGCGGVSGKAGGEAKGGDPHAHPPGPSSSHADKHVHNHAHSHAHSHAHATHRPPFISAQQRSRLIRVEHDILAKNDQLALRNRQWLAARGVLALNLVSSPGSGKTTLLERTISDLGAALPMHVIQGDQATERDAERIRRAGAPATQLSTGVGCHLDAAMIARCLGELTHMVSGSLLAIENVGNLVCPALFDLGEHAKVVIASVTEGEDKPLKYPHMFRASRLMLISKTDLLPHLSFDVEACVEFARQVNPEIEVMRISAASGDGMASWYAWLRARLNSAAISASAVEP